MDPSHCKDANTTARESKEAIGRRDARSREHWRLGGVPIAVQGCKRDTRKGPRATRTNDGGFVQGSRGDTGHSLRSAHHLLSAAESGVQQHQFPGVGHRSGQWDVHVVGGQRQQRGQ